MTHPGRREIDLLAAKDSISADDPDDTEVYDVYNVFAVLAGSDPTEVCRIMLDHRYLGLVPQYRWARNDSVIVDCIRVPTDSVDMSLTDLVCRSTQRFLCQYNDGDPVGWGAPIDVLTMFQVRRRIKGQWHWQRVPPSTLMCISTGGEIISSCVDKQDGISPSRGLVTCCDSLLFDGTDDAADCPGAEECRECQYAEEAADCQHQADNIPNVIRRMGMWPVDEYIGAHRAAVLGALDEGGCQPLAIAVIADVIADYYCPRLEVPHPISDPSEPGDIDNRYEQWIDSLHRWELEKSQMMERKSLAPKREGIMRSRKIQRMRRSLLEREIITGTPTYRRVLSRIYSIPKRNRSELVHNLMGSGEIDELEGDYLLEYCDVTPVGPAARRRRKELAARREEVAKLNGFGKDEAIDDSDRD